MTKSKGTKRQTRVLQKNFPSLALNKALRIANAIWDDFAGDGTPPHEIALAIDMSPTSGPWRELVGASSAYGLTKGTYTSKEIVLTELGRRIVAPEVEGDDRHAMVESILKPKIMKAFFEKYDRSKFPQDRIAANVLCSLGLPNDRSEAAVEALKEAGTAVGIIRDTKTGKFVSIQLPKKLDIADVSGHADDVTGDHVEANELERGEDAHDSGKRPPPIASDQVFISHGKNRAIVDQIAELLKFGKLSPVVSVDRESTAIPVPDKVFEDMRSCFAGVIHVRSEGEMLDPSGKTHPHINDNVLIEIGAAIALYQKNVVLLVEKGLQLPSNLQGLYRCEYEGENLDYAATMKLLKTFNKFE